MMIVLMVHVDVVVTITMYQKHQIKILITIMHCKSIVSVGHLQRKKVVQKKLQMQFQDHIN